MELLQDLTSSRQQLEKGLDLLGSRQWCHGDPNQQGGSGGGWGGSGGQGGGGYGRGHGGYGGHGGGTTLFDAIYLAANDLMKKQAGRKALILLTDGEDNASKVSQSEAITSAQKANTLAYSVRIADEEGGMNRAFSGPGMGRHGGWGGMGGGGGGWGGRRGGGTPVSRPDGKKILQQISKQTGGAYFEVSKKKTVDDIYNRIEEELRNQYSIGYTPDRPDTDGSYRKIQLTVKQNGLVVQARDGYYAGAGSTSS